MNAKSLQLCPTLTLWTVAHQAALSMGFSRQEYWSGLPSVFQGIFPTQESNRHLLSFPHWQAGSSLPAPPGKLICLSATSLITQPQSPFLFFFSFSHFFNFEWSYSSVLDPLLILSIFIHLIMLNRFLSLTAVYKNVDDYQICAFSSLYFKVYFKKSILI